MAFGVLLEHRSLPWWPRDPPDRTPYQPFWRFMGGTGSPKEPFWKILGPQNGTKTDLRRLDRHLGRPRWVKIDRTEGGPEMGTKNGPKQSMKIIGFWMIKTFESVVRS